MLNVDPGPLTLRKLLWMARGQRLEYWDHTASVMCVIANANRDPERRRRAYQLSDFHPFREGSSGGRGIRICKSNRDVLKKVIESLAGNKPVRPAKRISHHGQRTAA